MATIEIYTKPTCGFCHMAKRLLGGGKAARKVVVRPAPDAPSGAAASFSLAFNMAPFPGDLSKMYVDVAVQPPPQPPR